MTATLLTPLLYRNKTVDNPGDTVVIVELKNGERFSVRVEKLKIIEK